MSSSARLSVALTLIPAVERFPDMPLAEPDLSGMTPADARLATAIHRTTLQRWLTLEHLLARHLKQPIRKLMPEARAVLLSGSAQLVFMDRLPAYAVIDESVRLMHTLNAKRTAGMVNAVLRKVADMVEGHAEEPWTPAADRIPLGDAKGVVKLKVNALPKPDNLLAHLVVATSHPMPLLQRWFKQFGRERATAIALSGLRTPATFVVEDESARRWGGSHAELVEWLAADSTRRVQDPASLASVASLGELDLQPQTVLDLCAGRGTKTRQLLQVFPDAQIAAHDPDDARRADLDALAESEDRLVVAEPGEGQRFDLIVLDVPCSNTGVLARRPGARYRATQASLDSVVALQQQIAERALGYLAPGGRLLYCTCSIEEAENQRQADWLAERAGGGAAVLKQGTWLPGSEGLAGSEAHDGSYHAVVGVPS